MKLDHDPHRRFNPLTDEWILVSPHRLKRPWQGKVEEVPTEDRPAYDPKCYLCPGNERAGGHRNPAYANVFVFENDFAALLPHESQPNPDSHPLLRTQPQRGICRVLCFSPRHDLTLAHMEESAIRLVVDAWVSQVEDLGAREWVRYVQIFENKGQLMGCSNPHPHGQIWATADVPTEPAKEDSTQRSYFEQSSGNTLLGDYLAEELRRGERLVLRNETWAVVVPFWAKWPFEALLVSMRPVAGLTELTHAERDGLANALWRLTALYDRLFQVSFPYTMGFHQAPTDGAEHPHWHLHAHFYPPLLRSATVQKFMVGYEMLAEPQRDITAETAAGRLKALATETEQDS